MSILNRQRLRVYPLLFLIAFWGVTNLNFFLRRGWYGGFGGFIGYDFLSYYAGGKLYWSDTGNLYNLKALAVLQSQLVGIPESGMNYFPYPPFAALFYGLFSLLPYSLAFAVWTAISVLCLISSALLIVRYLIPDSLKQWGLTTGYLLTLTFSFYPTIFGLQNGQNHAHSLLLVTLIAVFSLTVHKYLTGITAALLLYKPQLLIGWLLLWLLLGNIRTLFSFSVTGLLLAGLAVLHKGITPYIAWLGFFKENVSVYTGGGAWEVSSVALVSRIAALVSSSINITSFLALISVASLALVMWILKRKKPDEYLYLLHALAVLIPFLVIPHLMFYDLVLLIPFWAILANNARPRWMLYTVVAFYFAGFILPILSQPINFPIMGILPLFLLIIIIVCWVLSARNSHLTKDIE